MSVPSPTPNTDLAPPSVLRLTVVVVNYNSWRETEQLTHSLCPHPHTPPSDVEIVVVDNHSRPHRLMNRFRRLASLSLRRWRRNRGFGRAVNEGVRLGRGEWLLLLNPDMKVPGDFLDQALLIARQADPRTGILGFRLLHGDGTLQPSVSRFPTLASTVLGLLRPRHRRKYLMPQPDRRVEADWLSGCCLLIRRSCFEDAGGFDASFFLYYEDVDLCRRAQMRGWSVVFEPGLTVKHLKPLHRRKVPPHIRLFTRHALLTYATKHWPRWQTAALAVLIAVESLARRLKEWRRGEGRAGHIFEEMFAMAGDFLFGRFAEAGKRVRRVARQEERRALHRHPEPQPPRPAAGVPDERDAVRAAADRDHRG